MNKNFKIFSLILFFLCFSLFADNENKQIEDIIIKIENSTDPSYDTKALFSRLETQKGHKFSQVTFDSDLKKLSEDFDRIEPNIEQLKNGKILITIKLWIKPTIVKINWHGNDQIKTKALQKELDIEPFTVFNKVKFNSALNKVKELYIKKGFFESNISYNITEVSAKNEIKIDIYVKEGKSGKIKKIIFKGFTKKEKSDLLNLMITKKYIVLYSWITGEGIFREDAIEQDKMDIINYLQNKGYADAKVDINILEDKESKKIIIELVTHRGTFYRFGKITYDGNHLLTDEEILNRFLVHPDEPFSPEKLRLTAQAIKDAYGEKGYIDANVYYNTQLKENEPIYNVDFYIEEGCSFKLGLIRVYGNRSTKTQVILRETNLVPGQTFNSQKLKAAQRKLESMNFFKSVNIYTTQTGDPSLGPGYRDINIEVVESTTGNLAFGGGYTSSDNVSGTIDLSERNFDHSGFGRLFKCGPSALKGGGEYLQIKGTLGARQHNANLTWLTPYFRDTLWKVGFDFSYTFSNLPSKTYKIKTIGGSLYSSYPITNFLAAGARYRIRHTNNRVKGQTYSSDENNDGLISAIAAFTNYDSTDNSYKAHQGIRSSLEAEFVGLGGKYKYIKLSTLNSYYYPIWERGTFKYKTNFQFIEPLEHLDDKTVPLSERFFLGGEKTVRGYKPWGIGPKLAGTDDEPKGGISSMLLSIEYNQEVIKPLVDIFFFADAGSVTFKRFTIEKVKASVGIGIRLEVMKRTPITVGYGWPVNAKKHKDRHPLFFYMGGQF